MQFKAGYIADSIAKVITEFKAKLNKKNLSDQTKLDQINGLLQYVSSFDVEFPYDHHPDFKNLNPVLATINNIITRGLPTRLPVSVEILFSEIGLTEPNKDEFEFNFPNSKKELDFQTLFELLHIVEPKLEINKNQYGGFPGSFSEWKFLDETLKEFPFAKQILQSQRDFSTIGKGLAGGKKLDFSFEFPYLITSNAVNLTDKQKQGVIFEFDGPHHKLKTVKLYDNYRDEVADENNFETLRQVCNEISLNQNIEKKFRQDIFNIFKSNFNREINKSLVEYSLLFIPLAVARIQKTILEFLLVHPELFNKKKIEIAIIERDLPCGAVAVKDLESLFTNINAILEDESKLQLPEISLTVFENKKWVIDSKLHLQATIQDEVFFKLNHFDIIIDHSILRRSNIYKEIDFQDENSIKIRSSHYFDNSFGHSRRVYCAELLHYKSLVRKKDDGSYIPVSNYESNINFFIQNIFRKVSFRDGQLPIISRALQQKPVIGLLPTGGGKSLTFQLPSFLQPGLCLVVDPIKSLMEDQVRVLKENWIDCCDFINSNLKRVEKLKKLIDFRYGETMFLFMSPERFVMEDFRNIISKIDISKFGLAFSYCVIDEVHCVSEWGHDFRSTYLMIGKNAQNFATTKNGKPVSLIGLTATASFDVLADIERELQIKHDDVADAIIMIENTIRPELFFRVIDVTNKVRINELNNDFENLGGNLSKINNETVLRNSQFHHFKEFEKKDFSTDLTRNNPDSEKIEFEYNPKYLLPENINDKSQNEFYSIVFCPVIGEKLDNSGNFINTNGVRYVHEQLNSNSKGFFYASDNDIIGEEVHQYFENFTTDKTQHIVCTKAFGMGIDKKDIRSTYHYVYSSSLESLVQEAGRSGRDKKISEANILVSQNKYVKLDVYSFLSENKENTLIQNKFTRKAIRQSFEKKYNEFTKKFEPIVFTSIEQLLKQIEIIDFSLLRKDGIKYNILPIENITELKNSLQSIDSLGKYKFILERFNDRDIHNYFHKLSFKGVDTEKNQLINLFKIKEFQLIKGEIVNIEEQDTLVKEFENCKKNSFNFIMTAEKKYPEASKKICELLHINPSDTPPFSTKTYQEIVKNSYDFSNDFNDFLFILDENNAKELSQIDQLTRERLLFIYSRDRESSNDTGRLIYRMHSMGFLEDYLIDYNRNNLYSCTFNKFQDIGQYIERIEAYLRRYLSENTALEKITELKNRLTKPTLIENILECLNFLAEFSYREIASKRTRATDEIETILNTSITNENYSSDWFKQNLYIKEQIYFYFNAKYARIGFKIEGKPYSLLDDYQEKTMGMKEILDKYLGTSDKEGVFQIEGTEQNNYKHMMGSCKKILRSLSETDINIEWLLRLLKAFSMYSVNNESYISEANSELELGFINLYADEKFHQNNYDIIEPIFESYFEILQKNIQKTNQSFEDIKLIRAKLLLKMQILGIETLITKNQKLTAEIYA